MARGIIKLPVENGRKETCWFAGNAQVIAGNEVNPVVSLTISRDADFVAKRAFLLMDYGPVGGTNPNLSLPPRTSVVLRDGGTKRGLSIVAGLSRTMFIDATPGRMVAQYLGLPSPFLIRANNTLFAEIANPDATVTPWAGNILLCLEGFRVYPYLPEEFPATITQYAVPFDLNANSIINSPATAVNVAGQVATIVNNGEGKFLAKGLKLTVVDAAGNDVTAAILPYIGLNITDSTSGQKKWVENTNQGVTFPMVPSLVMSMGNLFLPWNQPRYIDPNGVVNVQVVFPDDAARLAYITGAFTFPMVFSVSIFGALLPR